MHRQVTPQPSAQVLQPSDVPTYQAAPVQTTFPEHYIPDSIADLPGMSLVQSQMAWSTGSLYDDSILESAGLPSLQHEQSLIECMPLVYPQVEHFENLAPHLELAGAMSGLPTQSVIPSRPASQRDSFRPSRHMYEHQLLPTPTVTHDVEFRTAQFKK